MTKAKYEVWNKQYLMAVYVTEKRNAEDMIQQIRDKFEKLNKWGNPYHFKIYQTINGERKIIYTPKSRKFFEENLVLS